MEILSYDQQCCNEISTLFMKQVLFISLEHVTLHMQVARYARSNILAVTSNFVHSYNHGSLVLNLLNSMQM